MRIAYVTAVFPCPSEQFLRREIAYLQSRDVDVIVCTLRTDEERDAGVPQTSETVICRPRRLSRVACRAMWDGCKQPLAILRVLLFALRLTRYSPRLAVQFFGNLHAVAFFARTCREQEADLIHGYFMNLPGIIAAGTAILTGIPLTIAGHARDVFVEGAAIPLLARHAQALVVCHEAAADFLRSRLPASESGKIRVIHHGLDANSATIEKLNPKASPPIILAAGRFVPKKGFAFLIEALSILRGQGVRTRLILAGDGPQSAPLHEFASSLHVDDVISWTGWLNQASLARLLREASVVVVPSITATDGDRDGMPNIILEAWNAGVPVVTSALIGGNPGREGASQSGLLVAAHDPNGLANVISTLVTDPALQERLVRSGRLRLKREYDLHTNGQALFDLFAEVLHERVAA